MCSFRQHPHSCPCGPHLLLSGTLHSSEPGAGEISPCSPSSHSWTLLFGYSDVISNEKTESKIFTQSSRCFSVSGCLVLKRQNSNWFLTFCPDVTLPPRSCDSMGPKNSHRVVPCCCQVEEKSHGWFYSGVTPSASRHGHQSIETCSWHWPLRAEWDLEHERISFSFITGWRVCKSHVACFRPCGYPRNNGTSLSPSYGLPE